MTAVRAPVDEAAFRSHAKDASPAQLLQRSLAARGLEPRASSRVVELGVRARLAKPYLAAGARVIGVDASSVALQEAQAHEYRYHHLAGGSPGELSAELGVAPGSVDLILSDGGLDAVIAAGRGASAFRSVRLALDAGGVLALNWRPTSEASVAGVEAQIAQAGLRLEEHTASGQRRQLIARKPGQPNSLPPALSWLSRTSSVDRDAISRAHRSPLIRGPLETEPVASDDPRLRRQLSQMVQAVENNLDIHPAAVPLPRFTARDAMEGPAGVDALVMFAHPDDESGFAGGTVSAASRAGYSVKIASVTGGGGGRAGRSATRHRELEQAAQILGSKGVEVFDFPDFGKYRDPQRLTPVTRADALRTWQLNPLLERMVRSIRENRPRTLLTFDAVHDPDYALHGAHLGVGIAATLAFHLAADPQAFPEQIAAGLRPWAVERHAVVVSPERKDPHKAQALAAHRSQRYSLEHVPVKGTERWHIVQSRRPPAQNSLGALQTLLGP